MSGSESYSKESKDKKNILSLHFSFSVTPSIFWQTRALIQIFKTSHQTTLFITIMIRYCFDLIWYIWQFKRVHVKNFKALDNVTSNKVVMAEARQLLDFFMRKKFTNEFGESSMHIMKVSRSEHLSLRKVVKIAHIS